MTIHQLYISQRNWDQLANNADRRPAHYLKSDRQCAACGEWLDWENAGQLNLCQECWEHHCAITVPPWFDDLSEPYWQNAGC